MLGFIPWKRNRSFLQQITLVMGQRNQLVWDIPALSSFELNRVIYRLPVESYRHMLAELTGLLELEPLLLFIASRLFWRVGLRHYSGTSA